MTWWELALLTLGGIASGIIAAWIYIIYKAAKQMAQM